MPVSKSVQLIVPSEEAVYHHIVGGINPEQGQVMLQHFKLAHKKQRDKKQPSRNTLTSCYSECRSAQNHM